MLAHPTIAWQINHKQHHGKPHHQPNPFQSNHHLHNHHQTSPHQKQNKMSTTTNPQDTPLTSSFDSLHSLNSTTSEYSATLIHPNQNHLRQKRPLPPIPDLRFEESYLTGIAAANGVWWKILLITVKDQMILPLLQGLGYNLLLIGWWRWNSRVMWGGKGVGGE